MNKLVNAAAIATIIGAAFTVAAFYSETDTATVEQVRITQPSSAPETGIHIAPSNSIEEIDPEEEVIVNQIGASPSYTSEKIMARYAIASEIPYTSERSEAFMEIVRQAVKSSLYDEALTISEKIPYTSTRSEALVLIAKASSDMDPDFALEVAKKIPYTSSRSDVLKYLATK